MSKKEQEEREEWSVAFNIQHACTVNHLGRIPHGVQYLRDLCCSAQHQEGFGCHGGRWFNSFSIERERNVSQRQRSTVCTDDDDGAYLKNLEENPRWDLIKWYKQVLFQLDPAGLKIWRQENEVADQTSFDHLECKGKKQDACTVHEYCIFLHKAGCSSNYFLHIKYING